MIWQTAIEDEGPDGTYLVLWSDAISKSQISDDALRQLDAALKPFREHWAQGEAVRREVQAHRGAGYCTGWVAGQGPCQRLHGHDGDCDTRGEEDL